MKSAAIFVLLAVVASASPSGSSAQTNSFSIAPRIGGPAQPSPLRLNGGRPALPTRRQRDDAQGSLGVTLISTVALGVVGGLGGGALGAAMAGDCSGDFCAFGPAILVGAIGLAAGTGVGAHIGNGSRGNLGSDILGGAIGTGVGIGLLAATGAEGVGAWMFVPIPIVLIPVLFERSGARRNYREKTLSAFVAPAPGGLSVALTARW